MNHRMDGMSMDSFRSGVKLSKSAPFGGPSGGSLNGSSRNSLDSIITGHNDEERDSIWYKIRKMKKKGLCMNCEKSKWKNHEFQVCSECYKKCARLKCVHCKEEFSNHRYCKKAESIYKKTVCMNCAYQTSIHSNDPRLCKYCSAWAAWNSDSVCTRCSNFYEKFGAPMNCESCGNNSAFNRGQESRDKVGGIRLCFLCTYDFKKNDYYIKRRIISSTKGRSSPEDKSMQGDDVSKLTEQVKELQGTIDTLKSTIDALNKTNKELENKYNKLLEEYNGISNAAP